MKPPKYYAALEFAETFSHGPHPTPEAAIAECYADLLKNGTPDQPPIILCGTLRPHVPTLDVHGIVRDLSEEAYDECDEVADGWLDSLTREEHESLEKRLNAALHGWLEENEEMPEFGVMHDIHPYCLNKEGCWVLNTLTCIHGKGMKQECANCVAEVARQIRAEGV